ncbi:MAG: HEPN domain-containing protein [Microthrixaceae bacterium]|jgi:hypothetical protein
MTAGVRRQYSARYDMGRLTEELDRLFDRADELDRGSEIAGDINRYLCVRVSGLLEQSILMLGRSAVEAHSYGIGQQFGLSWLERAPNPSKVEIVKFVGRFSSCWADELTALLKDDERGTRLNSLIGIRNDVAHGKNQGVSLMQARGYYELVREVIDWVADRLEPKAGMSAASTP